MRASTFAGGVALSALLAVPGTARAFDLPSEASGEAQTQVAASAAAASAQEQAGGQDQAVEQDPADGPDITVTGTRVVRDGYQAPTPVTVLGLDELNAIARTNIADSLRELPVFSASPGPSTSVSTLSSGGGGLNILNLRAFGSQRTLVLLDGKRLINASLNARFTGPDVNWIPNALVNRVDVVTGGASAAYGSDAITGIVNFVLDHGFTGVKGSIESGVTKYGDDGQYVAALAFGTHFAGGRGHFMLAGEYAHNNGVKGNRRPWNAEGGGQYVNPTYTATNGQPYYLISRQIGVSTATPGGVITGGPLRGTLFLDGGAVSQFDFGLVAPGNIMVGGDWQLSRIDDGLDIDPAVTRKNAFGRLSFDVADNVNIYAEAQYAHSRSSARNNPNRTLANVTVRSDNPFIPASVLARMNALGLTSFVLGSTNADIGRFNVDNERELKKGAIGISGAFGASWKWDGYYQYSAADVIERVRNNAITANLARATDAVRAPNGTIVCRVTLTDPTNPCVPYNTMGIGVNSAAAIAYVTGVATRNQALRQQVAAVNLSGEPFSLWAGPVSVAVGGEYRKESATGTVSAIDLANGFGGANYKPNIGDYSVKEAYLEIVAPLIKDQSWTKSLDVNAAVRATDYTTSGYVTTWKVGATWEPFDGIRLRGTRSRDIRAPSLGELYAAGVQNAQGTFIDPFTNTTTTSAISITRGNPNLDPEKADTVNLGVVLSPRFLPGFQASVDYYDIRLDNAIISPAPQTVINACFAGITALCSNITRVNNVITTIITSVSNISQQVQKGLDIEATYRVPLDSIADGLTGNLTLRGLATYLIKLQSEDLQFGTLNGLNQLNFTGASTATGLTAPKFRSTVSLTYDTGSTRVTLTERHISPGVFDTRFIECQTTCPNGSNLTINNNKIGGNDLFDLNISHELEWGKKKMELFFNIHNLFNAPPPFIGGLVNEAYFQGQGNVMYDRLGTLFLTGVRFKL